MNQPVFTFIFIALAAYLAGSVNFSILLFRILGKGDPRDGFSGNPGATNVSRQLGKGWAALILALDMVRAAGVAAAGIYLLPLAWSLWPGFFLIMGNRYPVFHGFRGGKGVAALLGFTLVFSPIAAVLSGLAWILAYKISGEPFIGSFFMTAVLGAGLAAGAAPPALIADLCILTAVYTAHRSNVTKWLASRNISR